MVAVKRLCKHYRDVWFAMSSFRTAFSILLFFISGSLASAQDWHLADWNARAVVAIKKLGDESDTVAVKIHCQGQAQPDGGDYRIVDEQGEPVPFQLTFHDARRYSLISFRASQPQVDQRFFVYFGNEQAQPGPHQITDSLTLGAGLPQGQWKPQAGLVFSTIHRPEGENPQSVAELEKLIAGSRQQFGAQYQRRVSDGHNPFGPSDYYISLYRGWIKIPKSGTYAFCTASNEASFSFLNGKELIHWPGRHTSERGSHGEFNKAVELSAGLHFLEYYHEEVMLKQVAFLGWSPPGSQPGHFSPIPESVYPQPHTAEVLHYESTNGVVARFEPIVLDSIWPTDRHEGQYTRWQFRVANRQAFPAETKFLWQFGDGQSATGGEAQHVYLSVGQYDVTLAAEAPSVQTTSSWPLNVYEIQHVTHQVKQGRLLEYAEVVVNYDHHQLDVASLRELIFLMMETDLPHEALRIGELFVNRFGQSHPQWESGVRRMMALSALKIGEEGVDDAIANFRASIDDQTPAVERIDSIAQLIVLLGIERNQPELADDFIKQVQQAAKESEKNDEIRAAYRRAINAAGDVALWQGKPREARDFYRRVEVLRGHQIPEQVRAARVGAFPQALREYLDQGNYDAALDIVNQWEDKFATEKIKGHTFFWRGTILSEREQHREAARLLAQSIGLALGASFESEARWRLALCLERLGKSKESQAELAKLVKTGLNDSYVELAREKLKELGESGTQ